MNTVMEMLNMLLPFSTPPSSSVSFWVKVFNRDWPSAWALIRGEGPTRKYFGISQATWQEAVGYFVGGADVQNR